MNDIDVMQRIAANKQHMSKSHKRIAEYIIDNYDSAAFMTAAVLGANVEVSESTVVRFAMALDYDGYSKMQKSLQELVKNKLTSLQRIDLAAKYNEGDPLRDVLKADINNLSATLSDIDPKIYNGAVECMLNSKDIYIAGHRSASVLSRFMAYYLDFVFDNVHEVLGISQDSIDQIARVGEGDLMIGITFPRYSALTVECVRAAKEKGAKIVAITDGRMSPLAPYADYSLEAQSNMVSFVDSLVAPLSLINAIIISCGMKKEKEVKGHFEELERLWAEYNVYSLEEKQ